MTILKEVKAVLVTAVLSKVMSNYFIGVDIAKGNDSSVVMDWTILENDSMQLVKEERIERA